MLGAVRSKINKIAVTKYPRSVSYKILNIGKPVFVQYNNGLYGRFTKRNFFWSSSSKETPAKVEEQASVVIEDVKDSSSSEEPIVQSVEPTTIEIDDKGTLFGSVIQDAKLPELETSKVYDTNIDMRWYCDNDLGGVLGSITPTNPNNIIEGGSTYGFWETLACLDDFFYKEWIYIAEDLGLGLGFGLLAVSFSVRFAFKHILINFKFRKN